MAPVARPAPVASVAPVAAVPPAAQMVGRPDLAVNSNPDVVVAPRLAVQGKQQNPWYSLALATVTCVLILGGLLVAFLLFSKLFRDESKLKEQKEAQEAKKRQEQERRKLEDDKRKFDKEQAFYMSFIPDGYVDDAKPRSYFPTKERKYQGRVDRTDNALITIWSHSRPDGWILTAADDYGTRLPTEGEMVEGVIRKIAWDKTYLDRDDFEWERLPDDRELLGFPALAIAFAGTNPDKVRVEGEVYAIAARGYSYMIYTWAPPGNLEANRKQWADQRAGVALGSFRAQWSEKRIPKLTVSLPNSKLQMSLNSRVWEEQKLPEPNEPPAEDAPKLVSEYLGGNPTEEQKNPNKMLTGEKAFLRVYELPKAENAEAAYKVIEDMLRLELGGEDKPEFKYSKDKASKILKGPLQIQPGNIPAYVARTEGDESIPHQVVIVVIHQPDNKSVAVVFDMPVALRQNNVNRRDFFEAEISAALRSLVRK